MKIKRKMLYFRKIFGESKIDGLIITSVFERNGRWSVYAEVEYSLHAQYWMEAQRQSFILWLPTEISKDLLQQ